jgi:esterase/lipase
MFTANPQKIAYIKADGLRLKEATARFFVENVKLDLFLRQRIHLLKRPLFLMLAGIDPIIDKQKVISLLEKSPAEEKKIKVFENSHHMLEFEEDTREFLEDLAKWLETHSS